MSSKSGSQYVEAPYLVDNTNAVSDTCHNGDRSIRSASATPGLNGAPSSAGSHSDGYLTLPPSPISQAIRESETENWLEAQRNQRTGPRFFHGLPPPADQNLPAPTVSDRMIQALVAQGSCPEQAIISDEDDSSSTESAETDSRDPSTTKK